MKVRHITQFLFESFKDAEQKFTQEASEEMQIEAIKRNGSNIRFLNNSSKKCKS